MIINLVNADMQKVQKYTSIICTLLKSIQSNKEQESGKLNLLRFQTIKSGRMAEAAYVLHVLEDFMRNTQYRDEISYPTKCEW
jgi:hypothetical protein